MHQDIQRKIETIKRTVAPIFERSNVLKAGLFGSITRGEDREESDIDILVQFDPAKKISLFDVIGVEQELTDLLGKKVDLVQYQTIKPGLKAYILPNEIRIYEKKR